MMHRLQTRLSNRIRALRAGCHAEHHGNRYADWTICSNDLSDRTLLYSFGIGTDVSFDLSLIARYGLSVYAFDPTPRSIAWAKAQRLPPQFHLVEYGIADFDGTATFFPPENPENISHSMLMREGQSGSGVDVPVRRLPTLMHMLGHTRIDILKMDVEGAEYSVLRDLLTTDIRPTQLLVEFHHRFPELSPHDTKNTVTVLEQAGYLIFDISESGEEYSFLQRTL